MEYLSMQTTSAIQRMKVEAEKSDSCQASQSFPRTMGNLNSRYFIFLPFIPASQKQDLCTMESSLKNLLFLIDCIYTQRQSSP